MNQESMFCLTFIPEVSCQILEQSEHAYHARGRDRGQTGMEKLERELTYDNFVAWTRPTLKMEKTCDLKAVLVSMGMMDSFEGFRSNFSGMSPNNNLEFRHPFLFFIRHNSTQNIPFCGRYCSP
ncbi:unnamed protein product [Coregonus sp. 'balchen']|nr:unnamed protein product [Coregonus sp. 'balchen']